MIVEISKVGVKRITGTYCLPKFPLCAARARGCGSHRSGPRGFFPGRLVAVVVFWAERVVCPATGKESSLAQGKTVPIFHGLLRTTGLVALRGKNVPENNNGENYSSFNVPAALPGLGVS